jgi:SAM-dependent methyltransferase
MIHAPDRSSDTGERAEMPCSPVHRKRTTCRGCGAGRLRAFLCLGPAPLANAFLATPEQFAHEPSYPLDLYLCETCSLVQLLDVVDPEVLFRHYIYVTGTSDTMSGHNARYAQTVIELCQPRPEDLVIEIASNDGSLLSCFRQHGVRTLGVEPARNIAEIARDRGIETLAEFFDAAAAESIRASYGAAKVVIGNNVLAHVDETQDFLTGCKRLLTEDGLVVIEVPYVREMLDRLEYDTVYHEHLCYFSARALIRLCDAVGLSVVRIDRVPVHGGSLRLYAGRPEWYGGHADGALAPAADEREAGLATWERYERFAAHVGKHRRALRDLLEALRREGLTVAGYGAPAKGNTLLNYCGIGTDLIPYVVDKNPLKIGRFTPGMHIPILSTSTLLECQPDCVLILAWNFAEEIMRQQQEYRDRGGRFIIPIPEPRFI